MKPGKNFNLVLRSSPAKAITRADDNWLVIGGGSRFRIVKPKGGNPDYVGVQDVDTEHYWTIRWRGPVGDLHGVVLSSPEDDGELAPYQRFKFEEVTSGANGSEKSYWIKESTKGEYVSVGHNGVIVRWARGDGSTQVFTMKMIRGASSSIEQQSASSIQ